MTTTVATLTILCPDWCTVDPQQHADDLWDEGGVCRHKAPESTVKDPSDGPCRGHGDDPLPGRAVEVTFYTATNPEGNEVASPTFYVDDDEYSIEQVLALSETITQVVAAYRSSGGKA